MRLAVWVYVVSTLVWLVLYAPGMYRRRRDLLVRIQRLERRVAEMDSAITAP